MYLIGLAITSVGIGIVLACKLKIIRENNYKKLGTRSVESE